MEPGDGEWVNAEPRKKSIRCNTLLLWRSRRRNTDMYLVEQKAPSDKTHELRLSLWHEGLRSPASERRTHAKQSGGSVLAAHAELETKKTHVAFCSYIASLKAEGTGGISRKQHGQLYIEDFAPAVSLLAA